LHVGNKCESRRIECPQIPFSGRAIVRDRNWRLQVESHGGDGSSTCTTAVVSHLMQARSNFFLRSTRSRSPATRTRPSRSGALTSCPYVACRSRRSPRRLGRVFSGAAPNRPVVSFLLSNCRTIVPIKRHGRFSYAYQAYQPIPRGKKRGTRTERLGTDDASCTTNNFTYFIYNIYVYMYNI